MSAIMNNCQVEMLDIYDLWQVYMKLSGIEMSDTWAVAGMAGLTQEA